MSQRSEKVEKDVNASTANKLLVICIDRDNDVGEKAGIITPVIGRNACIEAAQRLALEDPEDADSNSIFAAIKTYEDLISKGYKVEVVTVAGVKNRGIHADEKILAETRKVLEKFSDKWLIGVFMNFSEEGTSYFCHVVLDSDPQMPFMKFSSTNGSEPIFVENPSEHGYSYIKIIKLKDTHPLVDYGHLQN